MQDPHRDALAAAVSALNQGDLEAADKILSGVLAKTDHPVALFIQGQGRAAAGRWAEAEALLRRALALAPGQPQVSVHLANVLRALSRPGEAVPLARAALQAAPGDAAAGLELAKALEESGAGAEAEAVYRRVLAAPGGYPDVALFNLTDLLAGSGRAAEAEALLRQAAKNRGDDASLAARLGIILKRQRRYEEALPVLESAKAATAREPRDWALERANVLRHLGRGEDAIAIYRAILAAYPRDLEVHRILAEFSGDLSSYDQALAASPDAPELAVAKGRLLMRLDRAGDAEEEFRRALAIAPSHASALSGLAGALETRDPQGAETAHRKAIAQAPDNSDLLEAFAAFLLRHGQAGEAEELAARAHGLSPHSQTALALLGLAWRAAGDPREAWLNDYENHVQVFDLAPPSGYADMESFNRALADYLEKLHGGAKEYFTQTLRGGTQLHDEMFYNGHALVDLLQPRIDAAMSAYIENLKGGADHPLIRRRGRGFRYSGSWSSCLKTEGFHTNHMHHQGWISSCYYVAVPDVVKDQAARQGWITFGEPSGDFGPGFPVRRAIEPKPGRLVLFPSFLWHGTVPFTAPSPRITIAFDAVPV